MHKSFWYEQTVSDKVIFSVGHHRVGKALSPSAHGAADLAACKKPLAQQVVEKCPLQQFSSPFPSGQCLIGEIEREGPLPLSGRETGQQCTDRARCKHTFCVA